MINALAALSAALSSTASLLELSRGIKNSELQHRIAELNVQLAEIKNGVAVLQNENNKLRKEAARLKEDRFNPLVFNPETGF